MKVLYIALAVYGIEIELPTFIKGAVSFPISHDIKCNAWCLHKMVDVQGPALIE